jgi:hypothetical protein
MSLFLRLTPPTALILRSRVSGVSKDGSRGSGGIWIILRDAPFGAPQDEGWELIGEAEGRAA